MPDLDPFAIRPVAPSAGSGSDEPVAEPPVAERAEAPETPATPVVADEVLLASVELAREALLEITSASSIGAPAGHLVEGERVLSLLFECTLAGYPGWYWTVSLARADEDASASVLETELMPGESALLAPDWVPWSERLAEYQAAQEAARVLAAEAGDDAEGSAEDDADDLDEDDGDLDDDDLEDDELEDDELEDDDDDLDDEDDDDLGDDDLDGVDIDSMHDDTDGDDTDDSDDTDTDGDAFEAADITGAELAALELQDDEAENAEGASDHGHPDQPAEAHGAQRSAEDQ